MFEVGRLDITQEVRHPADLETTTPLPQDVAMVRVEIHSVQHEGPVAYVEATSEQVRIGGARMGLIDSSQELLGLPSGRRVTASEAPEEWARGLVVQFRSADLFAEIVHDDALPAHAPSFGRVVYG